MTKQTAGIVATGIGVLLFTGGWYFLSFKPQHPFGILGRSKQQAMDYLMSINPDWDRSILASWDADYVIAYATAVKLGQQEFMVGSKKYDTKTGKVK